MQSPARRARLLDIERHPDGLRFRFAGLRVHHWHVGLALIAAGVHCLLVDLDDMLGRVS